MSELNVCFFLDKKELGQREGGVGRVIKEDLTELQRYS